MLAPAPHADTDLSPVPAPVVATDGEALVTPVADSVAAPVEAAAVAPVTGSMTAPVSAPVTAPVTAAAPPVALDQVVAEAGLEWVQTRSDLLAPATQGIDEGESRPPRPVRVRKARVAAPDEPLQMVETRNSPPAQD
jgi:ribonuclease E